MTGIAITITQPSGAITTFCNILDIRWQPGKSADLQIGYYVNQSAALSGAPPVCSSYFSLDVTQIDPTLAIPPQLAAQLLAGPLAGGTLS